MDVLILGANEHALNLALLCKNKASSITFFDKDLDSLESLRAEAEKSYEEKFGGNSKFRFCTSLDEVLDNPLVIFDFFTDNEDKLNLLKQIKFRSLCGSLFFTTSKVYSVSKIASLYHDPSCVIGLQYLQTFEQSKIVELVKGIHTSAKTLDRAKWLMTEMGKDITVIKDSPGGLLNRMTMVFINEAIHSLNEGIATPNEIDKVMELELGLKIGPLRLADMIGLDTILNMLNSIYQGTGNPRFLPCSLLQNMVYSGYLGQKTSSGFYSYSAEILKFPHLNAY